MSKTIGVLRLKNSNQSATFTGKYNGKRVYQNDIVPIDPSNDACLRFTLTKVNQVHRFVLPEGATKEQEEKLKKVLDFIGSMPDVIDEDNLDPNKPLVGGGAFILSRPLEKVNKTEQNLLEYSEFISTLNGLSEEQLREIAIYFGYDTYKKDRKELFVLLASTETGLNSDQVRFKKFQEVFKDGALKVQEEEKLLKYAIANKVITTVNGVLHYKSNVLGSTESAAILWLRDNPSYTDAIKREVGWVAKKEAPKEIEEKPKQVKPALR